MSPRTDRAPVLALGAAVFISMLGVGVIVPILPDYARGLGASALTIGLIFSAFSATRALTVPYVGALSDRAGRKRFLLIGLIGYAILAVLLLWTRTPTGLVINRAVQGVFAAMVLPVALALTADLAPGGYEGRMFGTFNTWFLLGFGMGPLLGGWAYDLAGIEANFLLMAFLSLVGAALVWWQVKEKPSHNRQTAAAGWSQHIKLARDPVLLGAFLCRAFSAMGMGCYVAFLPVLAPEQMVSKSQVGLLLAVNVLVMTLLQWPAGQLADRWARLPLTVMGMALSGVAKAAMPLAGGFPWLLVWNIVEGIGSGFALPPLIALATARGKLLGAGMGVTMAFFTLALSAGVFSGPVLGGWLADHSSMAAPFYLSGTMSMLGAVALGVLARRATDPPPPPAEEPAATPAV